MNTLTRRASLIRRPSQRAAISNEPPPPDYPSIAAGRSFNMDDLSDSDDDDDDAFISEAPPDYRAVTSEQPFG